MRSVISVFTATVTGQDGERMAGFLVAMDSLAVFYPGLNAPLWLGDMESAMYVLHACRASAGSFSGI